ncbi:FUSC family membrane protein, partial [Vibrio cholerae]
MPKINQLRLYWANKTVNYSVLILLTLLGVVIPAWYYQLNTWITPLILGVIAAALADRDDRFSGRLKSIILTLICFAIAAFSIEILFQTPWLFALGLFTSSFGFIMLG